MLPKRRFPCLEQIMWENSLRMNSMIIAREMELKGSLKTLIPDIKMESHEE
jgi:hypothetical protein